jgi:hypothetical protein
MATPPDPPWIALDVSKPVEGYASIYLNDDLARWPVRHVTRPGDNKSDPNIETSTYGLCSTCEPIMRTSIVQRGIPFIFFITNVEGLGRVLTGYYEIGWYAEGPTPGRTADYALAAKDARFVQPIRLQDLAQPAQGLLSTGFRLCKRLDPETAASLRRLIRSKKDRTAEYLAEIDRLERFSLRHAGFRYPTWHRTEPWTWAEAGRYVQPVSGGVDETRNASPTGTWHCEACGENIVNVARLKACPACGRLATLVAVLDS